MNHDYLARIAALEDALRQKDSQLSLVAETESFLRSALARAEEKIENEEREIEHLRAQIEKLRRMLFGSLSFTSTSLALKPYCERWASSAITTILVLSDNNS